MTLSRNMAHLAAFVLVTLLLSVVSARPVEPSLEQEPLQLARRAAAATTQFTVPSGYTLTFTSTGKRVKVGDQAAGYISLGSLPGTAITQSSINQCAANCTATSKCVDVQLVQYSGGNGASIYCNLYSVTKSATEATYTTRKDGSGKVVVAYNYQNKASATSTTTTVSTRAVTTSTKATSTTKASSSSSSKSTSKASSTASTSKTTSTTTKTTTTTSSASAISTARSDLSSDGPRPSRNPPANPSGAILYQLRPSKCAGTTGYVPFFGNAHWTNSTRTVSSARRAYIVQHGMGRDFQSAFASLTGSVDSGSSVVVAPNFYLPSDAPTYTGTSQSNWFDPSFNLAWADTNSWVGGSDASAVGSKYSTGQCSTYEVWDSFVAKLNDKTAYPALETIYLVGHSGGASFMHHYATVSTVSSSSSVPIKFVAFNAAVLPYFEAGHRPDDYSGCSGYDDWIYGLSSLPRYAAAAQSSVGSAIALFKRYVQHDIYSGEGTEDIRRLYNFGDISCGATAQGGVNRRDRNYAWWAYRNLLAGTGTDVSKYYGAANLTRGGLESVGNDGFNHKDCVVLGAGHVDSQMYSSACGQYALGMSSTPPPAQDPVTPQ